jgi:Thymidylate synthase
MAEDLVVAPMVEVGEWQAQRMTDTDWISREIQNVVFEIDIPDEIGDLQHIVKPNLPWAEDHFQERVCGLPLNPPPSSNWWPFKQEDHKDHVDNGGMFSHTYPERFWPKRAGELQEWVSAPRLYHKGIRGPYGDLDDLVLQLRKSTLTRQAYLPVWFPEDTGAVQGQRVPCTLGYHFMVRHGQLNCTYLIRSCDFMRHFPDDVYMACRLTQWVAERIEQPVGSLAMWIGSFHIFEGDIPIIRYKFKDLGVTSE